MRLPLTYFMVVLVWASTPLGIKLSGDSFSFLAAAASRMGLALILVLPILLLLRKPLVQHRSDWKVYFSAALGIFPALPMVYWSAQFISSGLISVLFGLAPFITGIMTLLILRTNPFDGQKLIALLMAVAGLLVIFQGQLKLGADSVYGVIAVLLAVTVFALSSVLLQRQASTIEPIRQTAGALLVSFPGLLLAWFIADGELPQEISNTSLLAVSYLAIFGSLLGFPAYFYLLKHLSASTVSLTTLMTPGIAIMLGATLAGEPIEPAVMVGAGIILFSLVFYQGLFGKLLKIFRAAKSVS